MAGYDFEFYETGTMSVTAGQKLFTGSGTAWKIRGCEGALVIVAGAGAVNFVSTLSSDAAGEFRAAWTGPTLANAQYIMWLPSAVAATALANHQRLAEIIASIQASQPESSNLTALSGLNGDAETLVRFLSDGSFDLVKSIDVGIRDPNGSLVKLAELPDIGTLGAALLPRTVGSNVQILQADGTIIDKSSLPISNATQMAINSKAGLGENTFTSTQKLQFSSPVIEFLSPSGNNGYVVRANVSDVADYGFVIQRFGSDIVRFGPDIGIAVSGNASVSGALSKGSGTFLIDHPKDPFNKNLRHGFVESTEYVNLYRGMVDLVDGRMIVDIDAAFGMTDGTFEALNADVMVSSLQNQYGPDRVWVEGPADSGKFTIICEDTESTATIAWMVTGRRNDAFVRSDLDPNTDSEGRFIPEFEKEDV